MKKIYFVLTVLLAGAFMVTAQNPDFVYYGNGNSSFGGPIGQSRLVMSDDGTTITMEFTKGAADLNDWLVIYIDAGTAGRTVINGDVQDYQDDNRVAISNRFGGDITFAGGFEATHAISLRANGFGGLWGIPATGIVNSDPDPMFGNDLEFQTAVGAPSANDDATFSLTFDWTNLGLTSTDSFNFVALYANPFGGGGNDANFKSDEFYGSATVGGSAPSGDVGFSPVTIANNLKFPPDPINSIPNTPGDLVTVKDWGDTATWAGGVVPSSTDYVVITQGSQVGISQTVNVDNRVLIESPAALGVSSGTLNLNGTISGQGAGVNQSGLGFFNNVLDPTGTQSGYRFAQFVNTENAVIESSVRVGSAVYIPAQTGAGVTRGAGNNGRAFRFISSPVTSTTPIRDNWQVNPLDASFQAANPGQTLGTHITGSATGANGFDQTITGAPSMFVFDSGTANTWSPVPNTDTDVVNAGSAYRILIRGDRNYSLADPTAPPPNNDVWLQTSGSLILTDGGSFSGLNEAANQFSLIGNPYQATMDFSLFDFVNLNSNFLWVWNPNTNSSGAYETIDLTAGTGNPNDPKRFIKPWQSFFVQTLANNPAQIGIRAEDKATGENESIQLLSTSPGIEMQLSKVDNNFASAIDDLKIHFLGDNTFINTEDAVKLTNINESLSRNLSGNLLAIEGRNQPVNGEVLQLSLVGMRTSDYQFDLDINGLPSGLEAVLVDAAGNTRTVLVDGMNTVPFTADDTVAAQIDPSRFSLEFQTSTLSSNSVDTLDFKLYPNPTSNGSFQIAGNFAGSDANAQVYSLSGQLLHNAALENNVNNIEVANLNSGIYVVTITVNGSSRSEKLIVK